MFIWDDYSPVSMSYNIQTFGIALSQWLILYKQLIDPGRLSPTREAISSLINTNTRVCPQGRLTEINVFIASCTSYPVNIIKLRFYCN